MGTFGIHSMFINGGGFSTKNSDPCRINGASINGAVMIKNTCVVNHPIYPGSGRFRFASKQQTKPCTKKNINAGNNAE